MWNYRVVRKKNIFTVPTGKKERVDFTYAIHEAYYDKKGHVGAITQNPVEPFGENVEELRHSWVMMAEAFGQPVLDYDSIPEPGYERKEDPIGSVLNERLEEAETFNSEGIPLDHLKKDLEEKWGPFDEEGYRKQVVEEGVEKERIQGEAFIGTSSLEELIIKICSDYREYMQRDKAERLREHSEEMPNG
jgi:hypothetical protein